MARNMVKYYWKTVHTFVRVAFGDITDIVNRFSSSCLPPCWYFFFFFLEIHVFIDFFMSLGIISPWGRMWDTTRKFLASFV
jgi:hypothetical protein